MQDFTISRTSDFKIFSGIMPHNLNFPFISSPPNVDVDWMAVGITTNTS